MTYQELRQKYPKFVYKSFSKEIIDGKLVLKFEYQTPPDLAFTHTLEFSNLENFECDDILIFNIGLSEMISYWKATCSPIVEIQAGSLTSDQIAFWHKLFIKGMGEYYYKNQIDFTGDDFLKISAEKMRADTPKGMRAHFPADMKVLVPVGGGKDSIVTLELLKKHFKIIPMMINPVPAMIDVCNVANVEKPININRILDPRLLELRYLNGHVPLSASIAFISIVLGYKFVALSNERSSDECNTTYLGYDINHQYSKSLEFETDLNRYLTDITDVKYFSFLRPLYELQITKLFTKYPQYFNVFTSCNKNFKIDPKEHPVGSLWCKTCPKCVSVSLLLGKEIAIKIMGGYPPEMAENKAIMDGLLGITPVKPFECVLTRDEALGNIDMNSYMNNPNMPKEFNRILKDEF